MQIGTIVILILGGLSILKFSHYFVYIRNQPPTTDVSVIFAAWTPEYDEEQTSKMAMRMAMTGVGCERWANVSIMVRNDTLFHLNCSSESMAISLGTVDYMHAVDFAVNQSLNTQKPVILVLGFPCMDASYIPQANFDRLSSAMRKAWCHDVGILVVVDGPCDNDGFPISTMPGGTGVYRAEMNRYGYSVEELEEAGVIHFLWEDVVPYMLQHFSKNQYPFMQRIQAMTCPPRNLTRSFLPPLRFEL